MSITVSPSAALSTGGLEITSPSPDIVESTSPPVSSDDPIERDDHEELDRFDDQLERLAFERTPSLSKTHDSLFLPLYAWPHKLELKYYIGRWPESISPEKQNAIEQALLYAQDLESLDLENSVVKDVDLPEAIVNAVRDAAEYISNNTPFKLVEAHRGEEPDIVIVGLAENEGLAAASLVKQADVKLDKDLFNSEGGLGAFSGAFEKLPEAERNRLLVEKHQELLALNDHPAVMIVRPLLYSSIADSADLKLKQFFVILHEFGHFLGLAHPFQDSNKAGGPITDPDLTGPPHSVMFTDFHESAKRAILDKIGAPPSPFHHLLPVKSNLPKSLGSLDLEALDHIASHIRSHIGPGDIPHGRFGDSHYIFRDGPQATRLEWLDWEGGKLVGKGLVPSTSEGYLLTVIADRGGYDTFDFRHSTGPITADLRPAGWIKFSEQALPKYTWSAINGRDKSADHITGTIPENGNAILSSHQGPEFRIERVFASPGDDEITLNDADNVYYALGGKDVVTGLGGRDSYVFGRGSGSLRVTDFEAGPSGDRLILDRSLGISAIQAAFQRAVPRADGEGIELLFDDDDQIILDGVRLSDVSANIVIPDMLVI